MKDLLKIPLDLAFERMLKIIPKTEIETAYFDIRNVSPFDIPKFIKLHNIPTDCYFSGMPNSYDGFDFPALCYDYKVNLSEKELNKRYVNKFESIAVKFVKDVLETNGYLPKYKRLQNFNQLYEFKSVFDSYIEKDFIKLSIYYSQFFNK